MKLVERALSQSRQRPCVAFDAINCEKECAFMGLCFAIEMGCSNEFGIVGIIYCIRPFDLKRCTVLW